MRAGEGRRDGRADGRTGGRTKGRADGRKDGRTDGRRTGGEAREKGGGDREERVAASQGGRESDGDMVRFATKNKQQKRSSSGFFESRAGGLPRGRSALKKRGFFSGRCF